MLKVNHTLETLLIGNLGISENAAISISEGLKVNKSITRLDLSGLHINDEQLNVINY